MKLNKYIFATLITSTTLFLGSCSDFLDRSPQGQFTEDDNPNALVNGKIYNVYTMMRNYNVTAGPPAFAIHCFRSEDSEKGSIASDGSDVAEMYDDFVYTPTNGLLGAYWGQNYAIIYQCNEILDAIAEKETAGQTETEDIINKGKKHSHHEESPKAILTLLQPPLKGRTHLYYYITKKRKIVNTISVIFLFLQKQTFFKFKQSFYAYLIVSFTILYQSTIIIYFCLCQLNIKIIISVLIYSFINFKY